MSVQFIRVLSICVLVLIPAPQIQDPKATLLVTIDGPDQRLGELTEGAMGYFKILRKDVLFLEKEAPGRASGFRSIRLEIPAGDFELVSYVRGTLMRPTGPPLDECRGFFSIRDGEILYASRAQQSQSKCRLLFSTTIPASAESRR